MWLMWLREVLPQLISAHCECQVMKFEQAGKQREFETLRSSMAMISGGALRPSLPWMLRE